MAQLFKTLSACGSLVLLVLTLGVSGWVLLTEGPAPAGLLLLGVGLLLGLAQSLLRLTARLFG
jgi:hypothetical protein